MRKDSWEIYSGIRARGPLIVRADGRGFKKALAPFKKPYDLEFAQAIAGAARAFLESSELAPVLAYVFSDEVNILFLDPPFNGRVEKLNSVAAGYLSAVLSLSLGRVMTMDSRIIPLCPGEVEEYLAACQNEVWLNHVFSYGFYALVKEGKAHDQAMSILRGMKESEIHELLFQRGVNLAKTPAWERRGVLVYRRDGEIVEDWELPMFRDEEGRRLLEGILADKKTD